MKQKNITMTFIEKEASKFSESIFSGSTYNNLENIKSKLDSKIYLFSREKDKLDFLVYLKKEIREDKINHEKTCSTNGCTYSEDREIALFSIDQEIDSISTYYKYEPISEDTFSNEERTDMFFKLDKVIEQLEKLGYGQEVIFNEIDELKEHFNLGKKSWIDLMVGKMLRLTGEKMIEDTVSKEAVNFLLNGFKNITASFLE